MTDSEFHYLVNFVKKNYGINLTHKRILVEGRLSGYLHSHGFANYSDYIKALEKDTSGAELINLLNKITTNHTYFMREAEHFDYFANQVLPYLEKTVLDRDLRIWCAASSSGEEPYTLAMILQDYFGNRMPAWDKKILASDLSVQVLERAKAGIYPLEAAQTLPIQWQKKYFTTLDDKRVQVVPSLRSEVVFRRINLMDPIAMKKPLQVIFCRNVMIYFDAPTKNDLVERLYDCLVPGGFLFVGQTESVPKPTRFRYVMPSVYQKGN